MSLFHRVANIFHGLLESGVEKVEDPEMIIKDTVQQVKDETPKIQEAFSGAIAHYHELEAKEQALKAAIAKLQQDMKRAAEKNNDQVGMLLAQQLTSKQRELQEVEAELTNAAASAKMAQEKFNTWRNKVDNIQKTAVAKLDANKQAQAQETMNKASQMIDQDITGTIGNAFEKIDSRLARANAVAELNTDPVQSQLDTFDAQCQQDDAAAVWKKFKDQQAATAAPVAG